MDFDKTHLKESPADRANIFSRIFYFWLVPFLRKGCDKELTQGDVYRCLREDSSEELGKIFSREWNNELKRADKADNTSPKLWRVIRNVIWKRYVLIGAGFCINDLVIKTVQSLALRSFIRAFQQDNSDKADATYNKFLYAGILALTTFGHAIIIQRLIAASQHLGTKCRIGVSSLIYRKALKLSKSDSDQTNVGKMINLLSSDVNRFINGLNLLHFLYIAPAQFLISSYLLWQELGVACFGGIGAILLLLPLQVYVGRVGMYFRTRISKRTDERGRFLNEIIRGIRLIKMYTWEEPFAKTLAKLRRLEVSLLQKRMYMKGIFMALDYTATKLISFCALVLYMLMGNPITADKAFFAFSLFNALLSTALAKLPLAASHGGELITTFARFEKFLLSSESAFSQIPSEEEDGHVNLTGKASIIMKNFSAGWRKEEDVLKKLSCHLSGDKLLMIVGQVGSGKSSFLNAILSELPYTSTHPGSFQTRGRLSYASQDAWIFPGSVRENILFGLEMDQGKYWRILQLACLTKDIDNLPEGDLTLVGERGTSLSGGQKARVNLARALYQDADIYLLDDPLSAVDPRVGKLVFNECIKEHLTGKLRVLVTHQLQYLAQADHIIVLNRNGEIWAQGTYEELQNNKEINLTKLINEDYLKSTSPDAFVSEESETKSKKTMTTVPKADKPEQTAPVLASSPVKQRTQSGVDFDVFLQYFRLGGSQVTLIFLLFAFIFSQYLSNQMDYWLASWKDVATQKDESSGNSGIKGHCVNFDETCSADKSECPENGVPSDPIYRHALMYCWITATFILVSFFRSIFFFRYCMNISRNIHDLMFASVVRAPVKFFDETPSGRIMNRFTKDINQIDEELVISFHEIFQNFLALLGMLVLNVTTNYYTAAPAILLLFALWNLRGFYLPAAMDLKRLETPAKSPMFTHVTMTLHGLTTIRALKAENRVLKKFENIQDNHTAVYYLVVCLRCWFGLWVEVFSNVFLAVVLFGFVIDNSADGGNVGVIITAILGLAVNLQWGVRQSAEMETHMTSVERALEYCNIKPEADLQTKEDKTLPYDWPREGSLNFQDVSLAHDNLGENLVLKSISFSIKSKEKIGIVGRTGAGKSSLISALHRLTEISEGSITIDNVPTKKLGLHTLRSKISIIPQDPVLFTGTLRYNLDPLQEYSDKQIHQALVEVDMEQTVESLDYQVSDGGTNFSTGERQLLCLARTILRKNTRILVLDEATANVDPATDQLVQRTIRTKFSDCTVLTIAHRLETVMDCDKILLMDSGKVMEFDHPNVLQENKGSLFSAMLNQNKINEDG